MKTGIKFDTLDHPIQVKLWTKRKSAYLVQLDFGLIKARHEKVH